MGKPSGKVAYTIEEAAMCIGRDPRIIVEAIRAKELVARECNGAPIILRVDVVKWLRTLPNWYVTN